MLLREEIGKIAPIVCDFIDIGYCSKNKKWCGSIPNCDIKKAREKVLISPELTRERYKLAKEQKKSENAEIKRINKCIEKGTWETAQDIDEMSKGELTKEVLKLSGEVTRLKEIVEAMVERWDE